MGWGWGGAGGQTLCRWGSVGETVPAGLVGKDAPAASDALPDPLCAGHPPIDPVPVVAACLPRPHGLPPKQERLLQKRVASEDEGVDAALEASIQQWEQCSALVYAVLDDLSQLLTLSEFVTIVCELLRHDDPQVRVTPLSFLCNACPKLHLPA